jgi:biopolymer transport protein ExbD
MNRPEINVTPLIDVLLVLLIIFMVVAPIRPSSFHARIPDEPINDPKIVPHPDTLVVAYPAGSAIKLNGQSLDATIADTSSLTARLRTIFAERKTNLNEQRTVFIKAPKTLSYGEVAILIDAVKAGGADPVSLQIDNLE